MTMQYEGCVDTFPKPPSGLLLQLEEQKQVLVTHQPPR